MNHATTLLIFLSISGAVGILGRTLLKWRTKRPVRSTGMFRQPAFGSYTKALAQAVPMRSSSKRLIERDLRSSGNYSWTASDDFLARRNLGTGAIVVLTALCFTAGLADGVELMVAISGLIISILMFCVPRLLLSQVARSRLRVIEKGIPDALDMLCMSIVSGLPLVTALADITAQIGRTNRALAQELRIVARQSQANSLEVAFQEFARRIELPEVAAWCAVMAQNHALGGHLVDSLDAYARRIRAERRNRSERAGNTASIKLLLPVIICLCPPIGVMLVGPAVLDLRDFFTRSKNSLQIVQPLQNVVRNSGDSR